MCLQKFREQTIGGRFRRLGFGFGVELGQLQPQVDEVASGIAADRVGLGAKQLAKDNDGLDAGFGQLSAFGPSHSGLPRQGKQVGPAANGRLTPVQGVGNNVPATASGPQFRRAM